MGRIGPGPLLSQSVASSPAPDTKRPSALICFRTQAHVHSYVTLEENPRAHSTLAGTLRLEIKTTTATQSANKAQTHCELAASCRAWQLQLQPRIHRTEDPVLSRRQELAKKTLQFGPVCLRWLNIKTFEKKKKSAKHEEGHSRSTTNAAARMIFSLSLKKNMWQSAFDHVFNLRNTTAVSHTGPSRASTWHESAI